MHIRKYIDVHMQGCGRSLSRLTDLLRVSRVLNMFAFYYVDVIGDCAQVIFDKV